MEFVAPRWRADETVSNHDSSSSGNGNGREIRDKNDMVTIIYLPENKLCCCILEFYRLPLLNINIVLVLDVPTIE